MARKKRDDDGGIAATWINTFADLMNLLLCFFVLLFAMSNVDQAKFVQVANSMSSSFSIFSGGGSSLSDGTLVNNGISQLNDLSSYSQNMGDTTDKTGENTQGGNDSESNDNSDSGSGKNPQDSGSGTGSADDTSVEKANKEQTENLYDGVSQNVDDTYIGSKSLNDYVTISADNDSYRYISISISGSLLYESGSAELTSESKPLVSHIGDILKNYDKYRIDIIGHTDNVPVSSNSKFANNLELSSARASNVALYLMETKDLDPKYLEWTGRGEYDPVADNSTAQGRAKNRRIEIRIYNLLNSD